MLQFSRHKSAVLTVVILIAILACCICLTRSATRSPVPPDGRNMEAQATFWSGRIKAIGGKDAYIELGNFISKDDAGEQHALAHMFGAALYVAEGVQGVRVCDSQFSYGCYHEFIGKAITDLGLPAVGEIDSICSTMPNGGGCQHGIGHGLLSYFGYSATNLYQAVTECGKLKKGDQVDGCSAGAFMEYNMRTMVQVSGAERPAGSDGLLAPCTQYTGVAQKNCALLQPQWWGTTLPVTEHITDAALFERMGALCVDYGHTDIVRNCFEGVGRMAAALAQYDPKKSVQLCDAASSNATYQLYCKSYDAALFNNVGYDVNMALLVCAGLAGSSKDFCEQYARAAANQNHELTAPKI